MVRIRARSPYQWVLVATGSPGPSRHVLLVPARFFPGRELILYHARDLAMSGRADASPHLGICVGIEKTECAAYSVATVFPKGTIVRPVVECGAIESTLTCYARDHEIELVVTNSHGHIGLMNLLLGSTVAKLLDWLPCDTLLVREPDRHGVTDCGFRRGMTP